MLVLVLVLVLMLALVLVLVLTLTRRDNPTAPLIISEMTSSPRSVWSWSWL